MTNTVNGSSGLPAATGPRISFPVRYYFLVALAVFALCSTFVYSRLLIANLEEVNTSYVVPALDLKNQTALAHLWAEEAIAGDPDLTLPQVKMHFNVALQKIDHLSADLGADWQLNRLPESKALLELLAGIHGLIQVNRDIALERLSAPESSKAGSPADHRQDAAFATLLADLDRFDNGINAVVSAHYRNVRSIQAALIAVTLLLGGGASLLMFRFGQQRARDLTTIAGQNSELQAMNQQLLAAEQQLRASNQQLMATEQQLRASNQQLLATEQQLRASIEQLTDSETDLREANREILAKQQVLEESERRYRTLVGNMAEGVAIHRLEHDVAGSPVNYTILEVNDRYGSILGYQAKEVIGRLATDVYDTDTPPYLDEYAEVALGGPPIRFETYYPPMDRYFSISVSSFETGYFATLFTDITERKRSEEVIRLNEARLESLLEISQYQVASPEQLFEHGLQKALMLTRSDHGAIFLYDRESNLLKRTTRVCRQEKQCPNTLDNREPCGFERGDLLHQALAGETPLVFNEPQSVPLTREPEPDSDFARCMAVPLMVDGKVHAVIALADKNAPYDNADIRQTTLLMDAVIRTVDLRRAVDERFRLEVQMQKLESMGILAGGIAHDFNNMLTAVLANINLAAQPDYSKGEVRERLEEAERATIRAKGLAQQLLTFARGGAPVKKVTFLPELIRETATFAVRGTRSRCAFSFDKGLWAAEIDGGQIGQVISNLVINSSQAMPKGGTIEISAGNIRITPDDEIPLEPGDYVRLGFKDHGIGIAPEYLSKIFDPYFTTKDRGNGLGLAASHTIIRNHNGCVQVQSSLGQGTVMTVYLPATQAILAPTGEVSPSPAASGGRVLVMDDEITLRELAEIILSRAGYETTLTANGLEAIEAYQAARECGKGYDAVILDLTVAGGMGGKETIDQLRKMDPDVRAIVSSGYSTDPIMAEYQAYGFCGIISKPYTVDEMLHEVHRVLIEVPDKQMT